MFKQYILLSLAISLLAFSCDDDRTLAILKIGDAASITAPESGTTVDITEENLNDAFPTIKWTPADFGFVAAVSYTVQIDVAADNFAAPVVLGTTTAFELQLKNEEVNSVMVSKGLPGGTITEMHLRVIANAGDEVEELISEPISINISPLEVILEPLLLRVPGSYQGWEPADITTVIYSRDRDMIYEGYIYMEEGTMFKFTDGPSWDVNWGDTGMDGVLDPGGDDISIPDGMGLYKLDVDINTLMYTMTVTNWGIIGDATPTGWDNDTDMTYDPASGLFTVDIDLEGGKFVKFRANDAWDLNLGDDAADGKMEYGGADITVAESGNYTVTLDLTSDAVYSYTLTKN